MVPRPLEHGKLRRQKAGQSGLVFSRVVVNMHFDLHLIGCSFKQTRLEKVSRVQWPEPAQINQFLDMIRRDFELSEIFFLQTCNRREFYIHAPSLNDLDEPFLPIFMERLAASLGCELDAEDFYHLRDASAARHFFCVASALDAMVLGETEIIRQIKDQSKASIKNGNMGPRLKAMVDLGLGVSKQVRHQTQITKNVVSINSLAYRKVLKHLKQKPHRRVVFVGAGHFIQSLLPTFQKVTGLDYLFVNRHLPAALAEANGGKAMLLQEFLQNPPDFEVLISATGASQPIFDSEWVRSHGAGKLMIDAALPRDIEPGDADVAGLDYIDLDQMQTVLAENRASREAEIPKAEPFFREGIRRLRNRWLEFTLSTYSQEISMHYQHTGERALKHLLKEVSDQLQPNGEQILRDWTQALMGRLTNIPILGLKGVARELGTEAVEAYTKGVAAKSNLFKS